MIQRLVKCNNRILQTRSPDVQMFARESSIIPHWRVPPVFGPRGSKSSWLGINIITPSYNVDWRRPSFSDRCCPCRERTTCTVYHHVTSAPSAASFLRSSKDSPFQPFFSRIPV